MSAQGGGVADAGKQGLERYFTQGKSIRYKRGEIIIRGDSQESWLYLLTQGYVQVYEFGAGGQQNVHFIYKPGELFPLLWLADTPDHELYYEAMADTVVYRRSRTDFLKFLEGDPDARLEIWRRINRKFNLFYNRVRNLQLPTAYERLVYRLLELAARFGQPTHNGKGSVIELAITHQDLANSINVSRETVSREFEKLKRQRLVKNTSEPKQLLIIDVEKLQAKLDTDVMIL